MRIVHISDTHISRDRPSRVADLQACIRQINALDPKPDAVIHTGDVAHDGFAEEYATARKLMDSLSVPYFVIPGNRDKRGELIKAFADGRHIRNDMEFVQYAVEDFDTRLIFADTLSIKTNKGQLCQARLDQIQTLLEADTSRPAALFLHHPPFEVPVGPDPIHYESWTDVDALLARLGRHEQLCGMFCGHVHRTYETTLGPMPARILSCVAVDLQKGKADAAVSDPPMLKAHTIP
jgi:Icc protein